MAWQRINLLSSSRVFRFFPTGSFEECGPGLKVVGQHLEWKPASGGRQSILRWHTDFILFAVLWL